jgi:hypothetical protein
LATGFFNKSNKVLCIYFGLGILTFPFLNTLWYGDIPLLAILHLPILIPANFIRRQMAITALRLNIKSLFSFSPAWRFFGPYALLIVLLIPLAISAFGFTKNFKNPKYSKKSFYLLLLLSTVYFLCFILEFCNSPGLTIY